MKLTTWPVIVAQALLTAWLLHLLRRCVFPSTSAWWLVPVVAVLCVASPLPWFVSQLMPDVFTGLLVIAFVLLIAVPARLSRRERVFLSGFGAFAVAVHTSHLPLALGLIVVLVPLRRWLGADGPLGRAGLARVIVVPALAACALVGVNLVGHGRAAVAPFGNVFLLARVLYDGPGLDALDRHCPAAGWRLCRYVGQFPGDSDRFLWSANSPLQRAGGARLISAESDAIIAAALRDEPGREARAFAINALSQLTRFATGDGLDPWPATVRPVIARAFLPAELAAYDAARQSRGELAIPASLQALHRSAAVAGLIGCCALLLVRRRDPVALAAVAILLALLGNAIITGGLSAVHDRYQARLIWLATCLPVLAGPVLPREWLNRRVRIAMARS
ncbi:MAG: hypothetical protein J0H14_25320 [Alphaproteobacteria bacterium]|nr:hypothetical protein [Alphaproteobacteria bacterium]